MYIHRHSHIYTHRLNQMSDYWEERVPHGLVESEPLRNALGSLAAGVCAGYLSHMPHKMNLATLKQPEVKLMLATRVASA
jgi:hypothetical protein